VVYSGPNWGVAGEWFAFCLRISNYLNAIEKILIFPSFFCCNKLLSERIVQPLEFNFVFYKNCLVLSRFSFTLTRGRRGQVQATVVYFFDVVDFLNLYEFLRHADQKGAKQ